MTTLSGCTIVRNCLKMKYPLEASIRTYLPICDEVVVGYDPSSEDGTEDYLKALVARLPRVRLVPSIWDTRNHAGGTELAIQSNVTIEACISDWVLYVQADEAIHEEDHADIRRCIEHSACMAALFERRSFLVSLEREIPEQYVQGLLRLFRRGECFAVGDAMTCVPVQATRGKIRDTRWRMFNYGRVGVQEDILTRCRGREHFYHPTPGEIEAVAGAESFEGGKPFKASDHPHAIQQWYTAEVSSPNPVPQHQSSVSMVLLLGDDERCNSPAFLWQFRGWPGNVVILDDETTDGSGEVMLANVRTILGIDGDRLKYVRRSIQGDFGQARNLLHELASTEWVLHVAPDELWDPKLTVGIEALIGQLERDGKDLCGFARINCLEGVVSNDLPPAEDPEEGLKRILRRPHWPPADRDVQFRLMRRSVKWSGKVHEVPMGMDGSRTVVLQDHWILHSKTLDRQQRQHRRYQALLGKESKAGRIAILVMLAPGCETALERLMGKLSQFRSQADVFASLDGVTVSLPEWVKPLRPPVGVSGIVRPTKWCVEQLARNPTYDAILRLTWDAELMMPLDFPRDPRTVYGSLRWNPDGQVMQHLHAMGIDPARAKRMYVDGFAILASMQWWKEIYCALPPAITHYCDDAVSCNVGELKGYALCHMPLANHRHFEWRLPGGSAGMRQYMQGIEGMALDPRRE